MFGSILASSMVVRCTVGKEKQMNTSSHTVSQKSIKGHSEHAFPLYIYS